MSLFWNFDEGRMRALWRIILQAVMMAAFAFVPILLIAEPLTVLHRGGVFLSGYNHEAYDRVINMIVGPFFVASVVGSMAIAGRWLDHRRFDQFGTRLDRALWTNLGLGFLLGGLLIALVFTGEYAAGWIVVTGFWVANVDGVSLALALSFSAVKVLCVGVYEEFLSRGYHLRNITEGTNLPTGIVASSAVFAILHAVNDNATVMSTLGLFINALLFTAGVLATGRLSMSIGMHIAWNLLEGAVFGFPVSGDKEGASVFAIHQLGPPLATGGEFGPEGGLAGIVASLIGIAIVVVWVKRRMSRTPCRSA
jgi:membrane protease YdiL (CAAX protease family)